MRRHTCCLRQHGVTPVHGVSGWTVEQLRWTPPLGRLLNAVGRVAHDLTKHLVVWDHADDNVCPSAHLCWTLPAVMGSLGWAATTLLTVAGLTSNTLRRYARAEGWRPYGAEADEPHTQPRHDCRVVLCSPQRIRYRTTHSDTVCGYTDKTDNTHGHGHTPFLFYTSDKHRACPTNSRLNIERSCGHTQHVVTHPALRNARRAYSGSLARVGRRRSRHKRRAQQVAPAQRHALYKATRTEWSHEPAGNTHTHTHTHTTQTPSRHTPSCVCQHRR